MHEKWACLITHHGYKQFTLDHSLFVKRNSLFIIFLVYVDDAILRGNFMFYFHHMKYDLHKYFKIKDPGLKYFLGLEVSHSKQTRHAFMLKKILHSPFS